MNGAAKYVVDWNNCAVSLLQIIFFSFTQAFIVNLLPTEGIRGPIDQLLTHGDRVESAAIALFVDNHQNIS